MTDGHPQRTHAEDTTYTICHPKHGGMLILAGNGFELSINADGSVAKNSGTAEAAIVALSSLVRKLLPAAPHIPDKLSSRSASITSSARIAGDPLELAGSGFPFNAVATSRADLIARALKTAQSGPRWYRPLPQVVGRIVRRARPMAPATASDSDDDMEAVD